MRFFTKINWKLYDFQRNPKHAAATTAKSKSMEKRSKDASLVELSKRNYGISNLAKSKKKQRKSRSKRSLIKSMVDYYRTENANEHELHMQQILQMSSATMKTPPKYMAKATKDCFTFEGTFHEAIGKVLLIAEFFGLMPVAGVTKSHPKCMAFSWSNIRTWYCILLIVVNVFDTCFSMYLVFLRPITFNAIEPLIFRFSIIIVGIKCIQLAQKWPALMLYWWNIETDLPQYYTQKDKRHMAYKIRMAVLIAFVLSLGEHLLNMISNIHYINSCPMTNDPYKDFFLITNQQIFYIFPYSSWLAIIGKLANIFQTFAWNYMDVFVMIVSIGLSSKFKQLNDNLYKFKGMQMSEEFWSNTRIQYRNLCILCQRIDNAISVITIISFSNNLYFICIQLLKSLNQMPSFTQAVYFYFSLFFLIGRTLAVSLYAADIHDETQKPLKIIRCIPKESWCPEVRRFAEDINSDVIALSGMKFFHLTRKLVLSVTGTIVTYELVLIQFHEDTRIGVCIDNRPFLY